MPSLMVQLEPFISTGERVRKEMRSELYLVVAE